MPARAGGSITTGLRAAAWLVDSPAVARRPGRIQAINTRPARQTGQAVCVSPRVFP